MNDIIKALQRRYATKQFDPTKKISQEDMDTILESFRLSPSSFGLEPWRCIQVKTPELRQELQTNSRGQTQITQASDLLVLAVKTNLQESDVDEHMQNIMTIRAHQKAEDSLEKLNGYKALIMGTIQSKTQEELFRRNQKQAYIAMGVMLTTCALLGIDTCPMEGFDANKYNELLGLNELGLSATLVIPVGYRATEDNFATLSKVRFPKEKLIITK